MKPSEKRILLMIVFALYLSTMVLLVSCANKGEELKDIAIAPYELTKSQAKSLLSSNRKGNAWVFSMTAQEKYNLSQCWAEVYEAGVLSKTIPVWELRRTEKETGPWVCKLGLRMSNAPSFFSWDCLSIKQGSEVCFGSSRQEVRVPDIMAGWYEPLSDTVHLKPGEDTILLSYIYNANGVPIADNQTYLQDLEAIKNFELVVLFKCRFTQSNA